MIDKLRVRNFRCLRDVEIPLGPLNFLIGPNNTGKSSFLDAMELLWRCTEVARVQSAFEKMELCFPRIVLGGKLDLHIMYDLGMSWTAKEGAATSSTYSLALGEGPDYPVIEREEILLKHAPGAVQQSFVRRKYDEPWFVAQPPIDGQERVSLGHGNGTILGHLVYKRDGRCIGVTESLQCAPKYSLIPQRMAEPCQVQPSTELAPDGYGLASSLDSLREVNPARFREIEAALKQFVNTVDLVTFPTVEPGKKTILFHEKPGGYRIHASEASDGLLLFLGYLTIAYAHGDASVLLIEEPETGVHPHRLKAIVELLRAISRGALGTRPVQVIATSHSPFLVDWCDKNEIIVFYRDKDEEVRTKPLADVPDIDERLKDFSPGELIFTLGEGICESRS